LQEIEGVERWGYDGSDCLASAWLGVPSSWRRAALPESQTQWSRQPTAWKQSRDPSAIYVDHEEIGQIIGTSRATVTRTLGDFKNKRLVALNGSYCLSRTKPRSKALLPL